MASCSASPATLDIGGSSTITGTEHTFGFDFGFLSAPFRVLDRETPSLVAKGQRIASNVDSIAATVNKEAPGLAKGAKQTMDNANAALVKVPKTLDNMNTLTGNANGSSVRRRKSDPGKCHRHERRRHVEPRECTGWRSYRRCIQQHDRWARARPRKRHRLQR